MEGYVSTNPNPEVVYLQPPLYQDKDRLHIITLNVSNFKVS